MERWIAAVRGAFAARLACPRQRALMTIPAAHALRADPLEAHLTSLRAHDVMNREAGRTPRYRAESQKRAAPPGGVVQRRVF